MISLRGAKEQAVGGEAAFCHHTVRRPPALWPSVRVSRRQKLLTRQNWESKKVNSHQLAGQEFDGAETCQ